MGGKIHTLKTLIDALLVEKLNDKNPKGIVDIEFVVERATYLQEELGLDSLDVMEVIIECEGIIGVTIPNYMIKDIKTKDDIRELFEKVIKNG